MPSRSPTHPLCSEPVQRHPARASRSAAQGCSDLRHPGGAPYRWPSDDVVGYKRCGGNAGKPPGGSDCVAAAAHPIACVSLSGRRTSLSRKSCSVCSAVLVLLPAVTIPTDRAYLGRGAMDGIFGGTARPTTDNTCREAWLFDDASVKARCSETRAVTLLHAASQKLHHVT